MLTTSEGLEKLSERTALGPVSLRVTGRGVRTGQRGVDATIEARWQGEVVGFSAEFRSWASPKNLESAIAQIKSPTAANADTQLPLVAAPYLSDEALQRLVAVEISGLDLCGNGVLSVPGKWLIYVTGFPNRFPSSLPIKRIFSGKSALVAQVLLLKERFEKVSYVKDEIERRGADISLGTVSKALTALAEQLLVSKDRDGVRVLQPQRLLDGLAGEYEQPSDLRVIRGKLSPDLNLRELTARAGRRGVRFAVSGAGRYVALPSSNRLPPIFTGSVADLLNEREFEASARFPDVEIRETADALPYFDARKAEGVLWTSPVQTYLDLMSGGTRERQVADDLRREILSGTRE